MCVRAYVRVYVRVGVRTCVRAHVRARATTRAHACLCACTRTPKIRMHACIHACIHSSLVCLAIETKQAYVAVGRTTHTFLAASQLALTAYDVQTSAVTSVYDEAVQAVFVPKLRRPSAVVAGACLRHGQAGRPLVRRLDHPAVPHALDVEVFAFVHHGCAVRAGYVRDLQTANDANNGVTRSTIARLSIGFALHVQRRLTTDESMTLWAG